MGGPPTEKPKSTGYNTVAGPFPPDFLLQNNNIFHTGI